MKQIPNRIMIIGGCGAGKSTLSFQLAKKIKLPLYHLDQFFWKPGWVQADKHEWIEKHQAIIEQESWIIEGNYTSTMKERLSRAELVIWLDLSRWQCLLGIIKRRIKYHEKNRPDMSPGCKERLDWEFIKYVWNFRRDQRPILMELIAKHESDVEISRVTNRKQLVNVI